MSERIELYKQFNQKQEKYTYYLIALSIAAIGYSLHQTTGIGFDITQIPLGLAILSWAISAFLGLRFIKVVISTVYANIGLIDISEGRDPRSGRDPQKIAVGQEVVNGILDSNSGTAMKLYKWQNWLFYLGML